MAALARPLAAGEGTERIMYMVSWIEEEGKVEASLGGRVTIEEMHVFAEELRDVVATFGGRPYVLTIDHSKAKPFDLPTQRMLADLKDHCLNCHAQKVVTLVEDEEEMAVLMDERIQMVLEGREEIFFAAARMEWEGAEVEVRAEQIWKAA